jgi:hypothetical protein
MMMIVNCVYYYLHTSRIKVASYTTRGFVNENDDHDCVLCIVLLKYMHLISQ